MAETLLMTEVKIEDFRHAALALKFAGVDGALEILEDLKKEYPKTPGLALAVASVGEEKNGILARLTAKNMTLAIKHGFDPETQSLSMESRKDGAYLVAKVEATDG